MNDLSRLYKDNNIDKELWNTLNRGKIGSRCFIKDGLYNRVDTFVDGIIIYYENVPEDMKELLNEILKSIDMRLKLPEDKNINEYKRTIWNIETHQVVKPQGKEHNQ